MTRFAPQLLSRPCRVFVAAVLFASLTGAEARGQSPDGLKSIAAQIEKGDLSAAESGLWSVLRRQPENAEALDLLGLVRTRQERYAEAEALLRRAIELDAKQIAARIHLGQVYRQQKQNHSALTVLREAAELAPQDPWVNVNLAALLQELGEYEPSLQALLRISVAKRPPETLPLFVAGHLGKGETEKARALLPRVLAHSSKRPELAAQAADALLAHQLTADAIRLLETVQQRGVQSAAVNYSLGRAYEQDGKTLLAEKAYHRALEIDPKSVTALRAAAALSATAAKWDAALELLARARRLEPDSQETLRAVVIVSLRAGRVAPALEAARKLAALAPETPEYQFLLGTTLLQGGDASGSLLHLKKFVAARTTYPRGHLALGIALFEERNYQAAEAALRRCLELEPTEAEAHYYLGQAAREQGNPQQALEHLERAVALQPQHAPAFGALGSLLALHGEYARAQAALERAAQLRPDVPETHYQLGLLFTRLGQHRRAQQEMDLFRKLQKEAQGVHPNQRPRPAAPLSPT